MWPNIIDGPSKEQAVAYSAAFKSDMMAKMMAPGARPVEHLAIEHGVGPTTLSRWKLTAMMAGMKNTDTKKRRPDDRTAEEKLQLVLEAGQLKEAELGEFLRRNGLHAADVERWRQEALEGLGRRRPGRLERHARAEETKRMRKLEKELARKDKALAEAAALLVLQKKVQDLWGDEDDDTAGKNGK